MYFQKHTKSLELISRLYKHFLSHDFQFGGDSSYLAAMNDYIRQSHEKFKYVLKSISSKIQLKKQ